MENIQREPIAIESHRRTAQETVKKVGIEPAFYSCELTSLVPITADGQMICETQWHTFCAHVIDSAIFLGKKGLNDIEDKRTRLLSWLLREPDDGRQISLRYITNPDEGTLTIGVIGKCTGRDMEESKQKAQAMHQDITYVFDGFSTYGVRLVSKATALLLMLDPFIPGEIKTISREKLPVRLSGTSLTAIHPFSFNEKTSLRELFGMLLTHHEPVLIDIALSPVSCGKELNKMEREIRKVRQTFETQNPSGSAFIESFENGIGIRRTVPLTRPLKDGHDEDESAIELLETQIQSMKNGCLLGELRIASPSSIPSIIVETIRYDFFGHGGKIAVTTSVEENKEEVWNDIKYLNIKRPQNVEAMLTKAFSISQAKTVFQLPIPDRDGVRGLKKERLNIINIPTMASGKVSESEGFLIAEGYVNGSIVPIHLNSKDLMYHLYLSGKSGCGKTTILKKLVRSIAEQGKGCFFLDPHGDAAEDLMDLIPMSRSSDVIYFDPENPDCTERLNLLENDGTLAQQETIQNEFLNICYRFFQADWIGPVFERCLRNTCMLALMSHKTLTDFASIWNDKEFRGRCLGWVDRKSPTGKEVADFWENELPNLASSDWGKSHQNYFLSKFERLISSETMRRVLSAEKSTINFEEAINNNKIIIARLPKSMGEVNSYMLGMILLFKLREATLRRASIPERERKEYYFIVDEFSSYVAAGGMGYCKENDTFFSSSLSEFRKFRVGWVLANQSMRSLGPDVRNALFTNVQSRVVFGGSLEDASFFKEIIPRAPSEQIIAFCPNYYAHAYLLVDGQHVDPFTIKTIPV
jgi:hypothetical protein